MSFPSVIRLKWIVVIVVALAVCAPLAADDPEGKSYEVTVSIFIPGQPDPIPVACTCLAFDPSPPACLRSFNSSGRQQLLALSVIAEVAAHQRLLEGVEIEDCSLACQP